MHPMSTMARAGAIFTAAAGLCALASSPASAAGTVATLPASLRPALYQALGENAGPAFAVNEKGCATLPKQKFTACFDSRGARFSGAGALSLHLSAYGRGSHLTPLTPVHPRITDNRLSYGHGNLTEWWRVLPVGFEQGFTIVKKPGGQGELKLALVASRQDAGAASIRHSRESGNPVRTSPSIPLRSEGGKGIAFTEFRLSPHGPGMTRKVEVLGWGKLRYGDLVVTDANGKVVPATLRNEGKRILIAVNDTRAAYPLTVDPLVWIAQKAAASDGGSGDFFGWSAAISGSTALVGAVDATVNGNTGQGAVYVFTKSNGAWNETQKLTASDGVAGDWFGSAVALDGTSALIGAEFATVNGNDSQGAAYVFTQSNGTWTQTQKLAADNGAAGDFFGGSLALSGSTAFIGAKFAAPHGDSQRGAVYVFTESGGNWTQAQELTATDGAAGDFFGFAVAFDGTTALIGAPDAMIGGNPVVGAAYVFTHPGGAWTQTQKLVADNGAAFDQFGNAVALDGSTALVGAPYALVNEVQTGAAYVFAESNGDWTQTQELTGNDSAAGDEFGWSVALAGSTALIGASGATVNGNAGQGAAYVFAQSGGNWTQIQKLFSRDGAAYDQFAWWSALSDSTALIGAPFASVNGNGQEGAAYFYGEGDFGLAVNAPQIIGQGQTYVSQTIATNNASAASPAVSATITVPATASFVSATATQGSCGATSGVVTCDFGQIDGNAGTATANVTLKAIGNAGDIIENTASIAHATPPLQASARTTITAGGVCPNGYSEYDGSLNPGEVARSPVYQAPGGSENAILTAPARFQLYAVYQSGRFGRHVYLVPNNEVHRWAPKGLYMWLVRARDGQGAYTLCLQHP